jgi:hypothetical protein
MDTQLKHDVAKYIQASQNEQERLVNENSTLLQKNAALANQLQVQKEASRNKASGSFLTPETVAALADNAVRAGFIKEANRAPFIGAALGNPLEIVNFLNKLASITIETKGLPVLGNVVEKEAGKVAKTDLRESDAAYEASMAKLNQLSNRS